MVLFAPTPDRGPVGDSVAGVDRALPEERQHLRAVLDGMVDPQILLEPIRDPAGHVTDLLFREANRATCTYMGVRREDLLGRSLIATLPNVRESWLLARFVHCVETGEPVLIDDFEFFTAVGGPSRYYDIRGARTPGGWLSLNCRDVTEKHDMHQRLIESEQKFRLLAENSSDPVIYGRDGRFVWVSSAIEVVLGSPDEYWIGRDLGDMLPVEDRVDFAERVAAVEAGAFTRWRSRVISTDGVMHWVDVHARPFYDADGAPAGFSSALRVIDYEVAAENALEESRRLLAASEEKYRLLADNAGDVVTHIRDRRFVWVSPSAERLFGAPPEYWIGREVSEVIPPDGLDGYAERKAILEAGGSVMRRVQMVSLDGATHWVHIHSRPFYDAAGNVDGFTGSLRIIDDEVKAEEAAANARAAKERADELYRESMDNSAVGMCLCLADGTFLDVNQAMCDFFGYDVETLMTKTWIELTAEDYLKADLANVAELMAGRIDSYRMTKQYIHASGHLIWGDVSVGHVRNPDGTVRALVAQIVDINAEVATRERLALREKENRALAQRLRAEIRSAADYVASTLPGALRGQVEISSRFLPALELGGDSFYYRWIDDDTLTFYLVDVSGHGVRPALQSMSVHNLIRLGSLPMSTLLRPERVLSRLNALFRMDEQDGNYFTMWYGVYESSTRTLRYASAGHPPVIAVSESSENGWQTTLLATASLPIGLFEDAGFESSAYTVPAGCRMVLFSDGAFDLPTPDGARWSLDDFKDLVGRLAVAGRLSADDIVENLQKIAVDGVFDDDCSVITLDFR